VQTAPVGSFAANRFGPYDMVGNVAGAITVAQMRVRRRCGLESVRSW
jgi:hypothetical protein